MQRIAGGQLIYQLKNNIGINNTGCNLFDNNGVLGIATKPKYLSRLSKQVFHIKQNSKTKKQL